jgi:hypothetical protein
VMEQFNFRARLERIMLMLENSEFLDNITTYKAMRETGTHLPGTGREFSGTIKSFTLQMMIDGAIRSILDGCLDLNRV